MKGAGLLLAATLLATAAASSARAAPVELTVDPFESDLVATLENLVSDSQTVRASGTLAAEVEIRAHDLVATGLRLDGGALAFSDTDLSLRVPAAISLDAATRDLGADLSSPMLGGTQTGPGTTLFDLEGSLLTLDSGSLSVIGKVLNAPVDIALDFGLSPLPSTLGPGHPAAAVTEDLGEDLAALTLTFPVDIAISIQAGGIETTLSLQGQLVMTGVAEVPEPSAQLLQGLALLLIAFTRRWGSSKRDVRPI